MQPGKGIGKYDLDVTVEKSPVEQRSQFCSVSVYLLKRELLAAAAFVHCIGFQLEH